MGPEAFYQLDEGTVTVSRMGTITVLDRANYRVVQFDSDGAFRHMFGRKGGGPGEFEFPGYVTTDADGVIVWDARKRAFLRFDLDGNFVDQVSVRDLGLPVGIAKHDDTLIYGFRSRRTADGRREISL